MRFLRLHVSPAPEAGSRVTPAAVFGLRRFEEEERQLREKREMIRAAMEEEKKIWTRSSPAEPFYQRQQQ